MSNDKNRVDKVIEAAMIVQGVDKPEDLRWIMFSETMTKKELLKRYPDVKIGKGVVKFI